MISLQRSMHSSQMYTPGPAMSFLTCFWLFPQNEHLSKPPPSPMRAPQYLLHAGTATAARSPPGSPAAFGGRGPPRSIESVVERYLPKAPHAKPPVTGAADAQRK